MSNHSPSEKEAFDSWQEATRASAISLVRGRVPDEPAGYYVARRVRLRVGDDGGVTLWLDCFAHNWTIGHRLSPETCRTLAKMLVDAAEQAEAPPSTEQVQR